MFGVETCRKLCFTEKLIDVICFSYKQCLVAWPGPKTTDKRFSLHGHNVLKKMSVKMLRESSHLVAKNFVRGMS